MKAASLAYDPNGRLFQTTINGTKRQYLYDGDALVAEYDGTSGALVRRYVHGDQVDEPLVQYYGASTALSERRYLHTDHQGSIVAQSNSSGILIAQQAYDAFGIPDARNIDSFGYTGQLWLKELGLYYYKARMYHPKLGRFMQTDPIGYKDDMDLYSYVGNDPVNKTDPTGLAQCGTLTGNDCATAKADIHAARDAARSQAKGLNELASRVKSGKLTAGDQAAVKALSGKGYNTTTAGLKSLAGGLTKMANKIGEDGKGVTLNKGNDQPDANGKAVAGYVNTNSFVYSFETPENAIQLNTSYFGMQNSADREQISLHESGHVAGFLGDEYGKAGVDGLKGSGLFMKNADTYACIPYASSCGY